MATQGHRQCHLVGARVLEVLEQTPSVRTVVLHARWSSYTRHNNGNNVLDTQGNPVKTSFLEEIDHTIGTLRERGYRVVLVGPVPEPGRPVPQTVMRRAWYEGQIPEISIPRDAYERRYAAVLQWLARWEDRGVSVVWPGQIFCGPERCPAIDSSGQVIFFDAHHLSAE